MKTASNIPIPNVLRWKEGQYFVAVNHIDNGYLPTEDPMTDRSDHRYEADFTITDSLDASDAINAVTRITADPAMDQKVVDNIEIDGNPAIKTKVDYPVKVSSTIFPALPSSGELKIGEIYSYGNGMVMVRQTHTRTIFTPEQTPALFSFYRDNATAELEWIDGEKVKVGWKRIYEGKTYECLQAHQTQADWTPDKTSALWKEVVVIPTTGEWKAGVVYKVGDEVMYLGKKYRCRQAHTSIQTWNPVAAASLWLLI
jgi:hypothetical protein